MTSPIDMSPTPAADLVAAVARLLPGQGPWTWAPLTGGVSSDIWRIDGPGRTYCIKRALPRLKVAADWRAPIRRNAEEVRWLRFARTVAPPQVPAVVAADADLGVAVLEFFDPADWTPYKSLMMNGVVQPGIGRELGELLARLHGASAGRGDLAAEFDNADLFDALRLSPFFLGSIGRNPGLAETLTAITESQRAHRTALIHGDFSPKNILIHESRQPVVLDAECATWGDPAFDVAFMLAHLLLKTVHLGTLELPLYDTVFGFNDTYQRAAPEEVDERLARLVPALVLARLDGKSPVEYLTDEAQREKIRATVSRALLTPHATGTAFLESWKEEFSS